jgi:NadR type nicotinamide-nucleotide adenylyltransferase
MTSIVITGPESTGKTSVANFLSDKFNVPVVKEYAVEYLEKTNGKYSYDDLHCIAEAQIESEDKLIAACNPEILICDTDLITIKIWLDVKFGKVDQYISQIIENRHYDYYILCYPDIEWEYDKFRENPDDRDYLFDLYLDELKAYNKQFGILMGTGKKRFKNAEKIYRKIIKNKSTE